MWFSGQFTSKQFWSSFLGRYEWKDLVFPRTLVHKNFKNHFYPNPTRFPGPQTKYCPDKDLNHSRHGNLTPEREIKCQNKSTESKESAFMSDICIMAKTMIAGFKRLPQRAYPGGHTSRFGSRTHFQFAIFSGLVRTPEYRAQIAPLSYAIVIQSDLFTSLILLAFVYIGYHCIKPLFWRFLFSPAVEQF